MMDQLIGALTGSLSDLAKAVAVKCAVFAAVGIVMLVGAGFLMAAIYMALATSFGAIAAATAIGATLITLGLVALAIVMQRDPGAAVHHASGDETAKDRQVREDDILFDLLVHSAMTGYATGQGDKSKMQSGFDQMVTDLNALGVFDRKPSSAATSPDQADRKMAG